MEVVQDLEQERTDREHEDLVSKETKEEIFLNKESDIQGEITTTPEIRFALHNTTFFATFVQSSSEGYTLLVFGNQNALFLIKHNSQALCRHPMTVYGMESKLEVSNLFLTW
ncbi:hypothetical protein KSP40_PGU018532 [Platanthera guangdongensis]|uniref:Uncharacterized protein n=1 Tax=Platanthera guangdongensis TaxID=2320717 RepID=A0ABR2LDA6_9ASPA